MQISDEGAHPAGGTTVLGPSLVFDLSWAVHGARSLELRARHDILTRLYDDDAALADRVLSFWDDGLNCSVELEVLAHQADALELTDFDTLRRAVEQAIGAVPGDLPLRSETPQTRAALYGRLAALEASARLRRAYFALLSDLWSRLDPWWQAEAIPAVERVAADTRRTLGTGGDWRRLVSTECEVMAAHLPEIVERHDAGQPMALVACALFGRGLYLDLPGRMVVGFGVDRGDLTARARTESVALRLRVLADPTRLAIFDFLAGGPTSVGEIARTFSLAQPTVSAHVKQLREAGLISSRRHGGRLEISVDRGATGQLAQEMAALLAR
jgi:ArsR family transcriptional regulator